MKKSQALLALTLKTPAVAGKIKAMYWKEETRKVSHMEESGCRSSNLNRGEWQSEKPLGEGPECTETWGKL